LPDDLDPIINNNESNIIKSLHDIDHHLSQSQFQTELGERA